VIVLLVERKEWLRANAYPIDRVEVVLHTHSFGSGALINGLEAVGRGHRYVDPADTTGTGNPAATGPRIEQSPDRPAAGYRRKHATGVHQRPAAEVRLPQPPDGDAHRAGAGPAAAGRRRDQLNMAGVRMTRHGARWVWPLSGLQRPGLDRGPCRSVATPWAMGRKCRIST